MKIYTKTGDSGDTALFGGKRVPKDDLRVDAYGTVDELNSFIGLLADSIPDTSPALPLLAEVQCRLFSLGSHLATDPDGDYAVDPDLNADDILLLESAIDEMEKDLPELRNFILPGGHPAVSLAHICRTVSRRAERRIVTLNRVAPLDPVAIQYLNRLSDYFFVLSRSLGQSLGAKEVIWKKRLG